MKKNSFISQGSPEKQNQKLLIQMLIRSKNTFRATSGFVFDHIAGAIHELMQLVHKINPRNGIFLF